ncbi:hypothetical protein BN2537_15063 [Streptomyces venezuelae]|nr:hypothetical protein BN2537_15063 [Streptomyces venezuelae]
MPTGLGAAPGHFIPEFTHLRHRLGGELHLFLLQFLLESVSWRAITARPLPCGPVRSREDSTGQSEGHPTAGMHEKQLFLHAHASHSATAVRPFP